MRENERAGTSVPDILGGTRRGRGRKRSVLKRREGREERKAKHRLRSGGEEGGGGRERALIVAPLPSPLSYLPYPSLPLPRFSVPLSSLLIFLAWR
jgi:hypothetical protein